VAVRGTLIGDAESSAAAAQSSDIDRRHGVAIVHQMMRQREACRTQADHQYFESGGRAREGRAKFSGFQRVSRL